MARRGLFLAILLLALLAAGTLVPRPLLPTLHLTRSEERSRILVISNPIHTDIALPLDDEVRSTFGFLKAFGLPVSDPLARWLIVGWGGRSFYLETPTWADLKWAPLFKALTLDRSVLHIDIAAALDENHPDIRAFDLDPAGFRRMTQFMRESFTGEAGAVSVVPGAAYGAYDRFFEARGSFNALLGCNTWTAEALRAAGLRTGFWNPLPQTLALSLELYN